MAMGFGGLGGLAQSQSRINVTPLIDVLLVLLIIFIMVAPALTMALPSEIPLEADQPLPAEYTERQLVVHVCADGHLLLNREEVALRNLPDLLHEILTQRGGRKVVFLDADHGVSYGAVIEVMDLCRDGGVETIGLIPDSIGMVVARGILT
ncbi:MAG: biopolymer transporter ExbD, partial [Candidatus Eisenbacteria sp.]|nr:biopolymer transporter ExbD [Candidatus Eisenbacteria bacterium]